MILDFVHGPVSAYLTPSSTSTSSSSTSTSFIQNIFSYGFSLFCFFLSFCCSVWMLDLVYFTYIEAKWRYSTLYHRRSSSASYHYHTPTRLIKVKEQFENLNSTNVDLQQSN